MNKLFVYPLKVLRKLYAKSLGSIHERPDCEKNPDIASQIIYDSLMADKPCMIARFGANELSALVNYNSINSKSRSIFKYIKGEHFDWWWNEGVVKCLNKNAGFFPAREDKIEQFCELLIQDIPEVDILGSWLPDEELFEKELQNAYKIHLLHLEPYWSDQHWSRALEGKKVLVVHPFAEDIERQYQKRELLFKNNLLPKFQLTTIKAVQSLAGEETEFQDWFEALDYMKAEIDKVDYDICLIGCGAYGFPLAAHVKRRGRKGFHLGGALQLLFGIRGKRWETPYYGVKDWGIPYGYYTDLINEHWIKPSDSNKPKNAQVVEGECYW